MIYSRSIAKISEFDAGINLKLVGVGFRLFSYNKYLVLGLGYSHYVCCLGIAKGRRQRAYLPSRLKHLHSLRLSDPYRGRGIQLVNFPPKLKEGKKR